MDRQSLRGLIDQLAERQRPEEPRSSRLPQLAEALRLLCRETKTAGRAQYAKVAEEIAPIVDRLGIAIDDRYRRPSEALVYYIEECCKALKRGERNALAPALLEWMHKTDPIATEAFLRASNVEFGEVEGEPLQIVEIGYQSDGKFGLRGLIEAARSRLILVAQNHWHMISTETRQGSYYWPFLLAALGRGVDIDVVAMHPSVTSASPTENSSRFEPPLGPPDAIGLWSYYHKSPQFTAQVEHCWTTLREWRQKHLDSFGGSDANTGRFSAYGAYFTPLTITAVDPEMDDGFIVLSPRTHSPVAGDRPSFVLRKDREPHAFAYYMNDIDHEIANSSWKRCSGPNAVLRSTRIYIGNRYHDRMNAHAVVLQQIDPCLPSMLLRDPHAREPL